MNKISSRSGHTSGCGVGKHLIPTQIGKDCGCNRCCEYAQSGLPGNPHAGLCLRAEHLHRCQQNQRKQKHQMFQQSTGKQVHQQHPN